MSPEGSHSRVIEDFFEQRRQYVVSRTVSHFAFQTGQQIRSRSLPAHRAPAQSVGMKGEPGHVQGALTEGLGGHQSSGETHGGLVGPHQIPSTVQDHRWEGLMRLEKELQHVPDLIHHRLVEMGLRVHRREAGCNQQFVLGPEGQRERHTEMDDHLPARAGAASFQKRDVALGDVSHGSQLQLTEPPHRPPLLELLSEGGGEHGRRETHPSSLRQSRTLDYDVRGSCRASSRRAMMGGLEVRMTTRPTRLSIPLGTVLLTNAVFCFVSAVVLVAAAAPLGAFMGVDPWILVTAGAALLGWAVFVFANARRSEPSVRLTWLTIGGDLLWVLAAIAIILAPDLLTTGGKWVLGIVTMAVADLATFQWLGLRSRRHPSRG